MLLIELNKLEIAGYCGMLMDNMLPTKLMPFFKLIDQEKYIITPVSISITHLMYSYISNSNEVDDELYKENLVKINPYYKIDPCKVLWADLNKQIHYDYKWVVKEEFIKIGNSALIKGKQYLKNKELDLAFKQFCISGSAFPNHVETYLLMAIYHILKKDGFGSCYDFYLKKYMSKDMFNQNIYMLLKEYK